MTSQIKITQLTDIGSANLSVTTLLPVVNMAGVPTTQKTTLGNLANVILSQSGGNYAPVAVANLSYSVANAAQPNITSVGTLTTLSVTGNVNLGSIANIKIAGGANGEVLTTDGNGNLSWSTVSGNGTYGNSNVTALLAGFGSNTITTTGNISAGQLIGNGHYITSLPGVNVAGQVNFAAVANNVAGGNVFGTVANATYATTAGTVAGANVSGFVPNANVANTAYSVSASNVSGLGNISTINLDGNASNVLRGDGTWNVDSANTGNIIFSGSNISTNVNNANIRINGNGSNSHVVITANGYGWTFEPYGNFGIPDGSALGIFPSNNATGFNVQANKQFQIRTQDGVTNDWFFTQDGNLVTPGAILPDANITYDLGSPTQRWKDLWIANSTIYLGDLSLSVSNAGEVSTSQLINGGEGSEGIAFVEWTTASELYVRTTDSSAFIPIFESLKINDSFTLLTGGNGLVANTVVAVSNTISQTTPVPGFIDFNIPVNSAPAGNVYIYLFDLTRAPITEFSQLSGNTITLGNATISANGNSIVVDSITVTNGNVGEIGNIASLNLDGNVSNLLTGNGTYVAIPVMPTVGNIATINLNGNANTVLAGDGNWVAQTGGGGNTGNVTFSNVTVQGDNNALNLSAGADFTANLAYLQVRAGDVASHIHFDTGNSQAYDLFLGNDDKYVQVSSTGNIIMSSYDGNTSYIMTLDNTGDLILAGGSSIIRSVANSSLDPVNPNVSTMTFIPDAGYTSQSLVLDPTAPGHIHLRAPGTTIEEPLANIFLGGENSSFEVGYYNGSAPNVFIHSGGNTWTFGNDGTTTFPTGNITSGTSLQFTTTFANVKTVEYQTAGVWDLYVEDSITGSNTASSRLNVSFKDNLIDKPQVYIENTKEIDGIALRWTFDENGNLNFPRDVAGNTDPFLQINGGANPSIISTDASLTGPANLSISSDYAKFSGFTGNTVQIRADDGAIIGDSNLVLTTNNSNVGNTLSWTFDNGGNLTLPGGGTIYGNPFTPSGAPGNTITLQPAGSGTITNQKLMIYPTAGDGDHIHMVTGNLYETELFMGSDSYYVKLANTGNIVIHPYDNNSLDCTYTFGYDGNFNLPGNLTINGLTTVFGSNTALVQPNDDVPLVLLASNSNASVSSVWIENSTDVANSNISAIYTPFAGTGAVRIVNGNNASTINIWDFGRDGNLSVPGNIVGSNLASPSPYITGFSSISLNGTGTVVSASSGNILTNEVTGTKFNFLNGLYTATITGSGATSNYSLNLPANAGTNGQVLSTDGSGNLSWIGNLVQWTTAPVANTSAGIAGQAAYDSGGNLYVCVSANTWAKFTGTTSW